MHVHCPIYATEAVDNTTDNTTGAADNTTGAVGPCCPCEGPEVTAAAAGVALPRALSESGHHTQRNAAKAWIRIVGYLVILNHFSIILPSQMAFSNYLYLPGTKSLPASGYLV